MARDRDENQPLDPTDSTDASDLPPGQPLPNSSDSSGLKVDDPARGEKIKEQLKRGAQEIRPMD
jgi:hypothetical protein